jgi:hypothetical protein
MVRKLLASLILLCSVPAMAQICATSNAVGVEGIGDGCSTQGAEYVFPHIGIFKGTFTPACDAHDKCYTQLGANYSQCDSAFYEDLRRRCDNKYNQWLQPGEWAACRATAFEYYSAVKQWGSTQSAQRNMQTEARNRSLWQQYYLDTDTCGTTPERTTLYAPALLAQINNAYQAYAGRLPTVYEFMATANAGDIVNDRAGWESLLYTLASQAAAARPPSVAWTHVGSREDLTQTLSVNPAETGATYRWQLTLGFGDGPSKTIYLQEPRYNATFPIKGFLKATSASGVRNLAIVDYEVRLRGSCGAVSGPCR